VGIAGDLLPSGFSTNNFYPFLLLTSSALYSQTPPFMFIP